MCSSDLNDISSSSPVPRSPAAKGVYDYDMIVIGSGPSGQRAAIQAAKIGKRVAVIERSRAVGGVCVNTGTIPSKALREAVLELTGRKATANVDRMLRKITIDDLIFWSDRVIRTEMDVIRHQMHRNGIELIQGEARFEESHMVSVTRQHGAVHMEADHFIIATGTTPSRNPKLPYDDVDIIDSDGLLKLAALPRSMIIVGGGVIGTEYASMLAALGVKVTLCAPVAPGTVESEVKAKVPGTLELPPLRLELPRD